MHRCYYKCALQTHTKATLQVIIELSPEYPYRAPRFLLQPRDGSAETYDPCLKDVEAELNGSYDELVDYDNDSKGHLLSHQLCKLQAMLAMIYSTKNDKPAFVRTSRGRDRKRPLAYDLRARANAYRTL